METHTTNGTTTVFIWHFDFELCPFSFEWIQNFNKVYRTAFAGSRSKIVLNYRRCRMKIFIPFFGCWRYLFLVIMTNLSSINII